MANHIYHHCEFNLLPRTGKLAKETSWRHVIGKCFCQPTDIALYVIYNATGILYVGESPNCIDRIGKHSWRASHEGETLNLHLFGFAEPPQNCCELAQGQKDPNYLQTIRRAIEAEVVLSIRNSTGGWPSRQHEIHFYDSLKDDPFVIECRDFVLGKLRLGVN